MVCLKNTSQCSNVFPLFSPSLFFLRWVATRTMIRCAPFGSDAVKCPMMRQIKSENSFWSQDMIHARKFQQRLGKTGGEGGEAAHMLR